MKSILVFAFVFLPLFVSADSNDFDTRDQESKVIDVEKLRYQLEIRGEILVFNSSGTRLLYKGSEDRTWRFGDDKPIQNHWSYTGKGLPPIALKHAWDLNKNGILTAKIHQYESIERAGDEEPKYGKLIRAQEVQVENLASITWLLHQDSEKRVIAKFEPIYYSTQEPSDIGRLAINSSRMTIYDNQGNLWASRLNNSDGENTYFGLTTHRGSVFLSYVPFKGAKEIGSAERGRIQVKDGKTKLTIESAEFFIPRGVAAKVYGYFDFNRKSESAKSVRSFGSNKEENFLKHILR